VTNVADVLHWRLDFAPIEKGGAFALHVVLSISLMQLNLVAVAAIIVPLAINVVLQLTLAIAVGYFILFRLLGRDYDAAVATGGFLGFGISSMPVAMATMDEIVRRYGPAPKAFLLITLAGSFFVDLANAFVAKGFFMLPFLAHAG
jgi:ESS family glutamate:Na+ symporter